MRKLFVVFAVFVICSCSVQKKLDRNITGLGRDVLLSELGEPRQILDLENNKQMFIYVKETYVRATEIGQGRQSLDPRISPGFIKEEVYKFVINSDGIVEKSYYEKNTK